MTALRPDQCWQEFRSFDIGPALAVFHLMPWKLTNMGSSDPVMKPACSTVGGSSVRMPVEVVSLVDEVLAAIGGENHRFLFRRLSPRQSLAPHIDSMLPEEAAWRRFQLPIITNPAIIMKWPDDGQELHLKAGMLYEVRADRTHEVVNGWDGERVHLQIDQVRATI